MLMIMVRIDMVVVVCGLYFKHSYQLSFLYHIEIVDARLLQMSQHESLILNSMIHHNIV